VFSKGSFGERISQVATTGVQSWSETKARLAAGWARLPIALDTSNLGWRWDTDHNLWIGQMDARR